MIENEGWGGLIYRFSVTKMSLLWQRHLGTPPNTALLLELMMNIYEAYVNIWDLYVRKCDKMVAVYRNKTDPFRRFIANIADTVAGTKTTKHLGSPTEIVDDFFRIGVFNNKRDKEHITQLIFWQTRRAKMARALDKKRQHLAIVEGARNCLELATSTTSDGFNWALD